MIAFQTSQSTKKSTVTSTVHSRLLVTAAAAALLFVGAAAPAEASCVLASGTWTCSGASTASDFAPMSLTPNLNLVLDPSSAVDSSGVVVASGGSSPGALNFTTDVGSTEGAGGYIWFQGVDNPTLTGNTAVVDNAGQLSTLWVGDAGSSTEFGGTVTVTNEATGVITNDLYVFTTAGSTVSTRANSKLGTDYQSNGSATVTSATPANANDSTYSSDTLGSGYTSVNNTGAASFLNAGSVTATLGGGGQGSVTLFGTNTTVINSGSIAGTVTQYSANSLLGGVNTTVVATEKYFDPHDTKNPSNPDNTLYHPGGPVFDQTTTVTTTTATGGNANFTNAATDTVGGDVNAYALGTNNFSNAGTISGDVLLDTTVDGLGHDIGNSTETVINTKTNDGTNSTVASSDSTSSTPTGGAITADNAKGAKIGGDFTANAATNAAVTNEGAVVGDVNISVGSSTEATTKVNSKSTTDVPGPVVATPVVVDAGGWPAAGTLTAPATETTTTVTTDTTVTTGFGSGSDVSTSTDGFATYDNASTATIGGDLEVDANTSAVVTNEGKVAGDVTVAAEPETDSSSYSYAFNNTPEGSNYTSTEVAVQVNDGTHAPYTASDVTTTTSAFGHTHTDTHTDSTTYGAGAASLTSSGDIAGDVNVSDGGTATFHNAAGGTVEGDVFVGGTDLSTTDTSTSAGSFKNPNTSGTETVVSYAGNQQVLGYDGANKIVRDYGSTASDTKDETYTTAFTDSKTSATTGDQATLTNDAKAIIGASGSEVSVEVSGQDSAKLTNGGTIWADGQVDVTNTGNYTTKFDISTDDSKEVKTSTSGHNDYYGTAETESTSSASTEFIGGSGGKGGNDFTIDYTIAYTPDSGASVLNQAGGVINGGVDLSGVSSATLENAGTITGVYDGDPYDINVGTDPWAGSVTFSATSSFDALKAHTSDAKYTYPSAGITDTAFTGSIDNNFTTTTITSASGSFSTIGGPALLKNDAKAVLGDSTLLPNVNVTSDTSATLTNAGQVYATDINVEAETDTVSGNLSDTKTFGITDHVDTTFSYVSNTDAPAYSYYSAFSNIDTKVATSSENSTFAFNEDVTGGKASLTNAATKDPTNLPNMVGDVTVSGAGGATLTNSGGISGDVTLEANAVSKDTTGSDVSTSTDTTKDAYTSTGSISGAGLISVSGTDKLSETGSSTETTTGTETDTVFVGNDTLTNNAGGVIGTYGDGNEVRLDPAGTASVVNNGTIYATVHIGEGGKSGLQNTFSSDTTVSTESGTSEDDATITATCDTTKVSCAENTPPTLPTASGHPPYFVTPYPSYTAPWITPTTPVFFVTSPATHETSFDFSGSASGVSDQVETTVDTTTDVGGATSYSGAGKIFGSLSMDSVGNATMVVGAGGQIGDPLSTSTHTYLGIHSHGNTRTETDVTTNDGATISSSYEAKSPDMKSESVTGAGHETGLDSETDTITRNAIGGMASLTVDGIVGGNAAYPMHVHVDGDAGATLFVDVGGVINGDVSVRSSATDFKGEFDDSTSTDLVYSYSSTSADINAGDDAAADVANYLASGMTAAAWNTANPANTVVDPVNSDDNTFAHLVTTTVETTNNSGTRWHVGGWAKATNLSGLSIHGDLDVSGDAGALATNSGNIWGDVSVDSTATYHTFSHVVTDTTVLTNDLAPLTGGDAGYVSTVTTEYTQPFDATNEDKSTNTASGHNAELDNNAGGVIGEKTSTVPGEVDISGGDVSLEANGNVVVKNAFTASIYGDVDGNASGTTSTYDEISGEYSKKVATETNDTTLATDETVTTFTGWEKDSETTTSTHTGGTGLLTNDGSIGQRFASTVAGSAEVTDGAGASISGDAGATLNNDATGLIGDGASAESADVFNTVDKSYDNSTDDYSVTTPDGVVGDWTTKTGDWEIETSDTGYTDTSTAVGQMAAIVNAGRIGPMVLDGNSDPVYSDAETFASGDTGASITNTTATSLIQGSSILARSGSYSEDYTSRIGDFNYVDVQDDNTVTHSNGTAAGLWFADSKETTTRTQTWTPIGGMATVTNYGKMLGDPDGVDVIAEGYGGAAVTNEAKAMIAGYVSVYSAATTEVKTETTVETETGILNTPVLNDQTVTETDTFTFSGGKALADNFGTVTDSVFASGFTSGTVMNEKGGTIGGNAEAESFFQNYELWTTNETVGAAFPTNGTPIPDTYKDVTTYVGNAALVDNWGTVNGAAIAEGFGTATVINEAGATINGEWYNYNGDGIYYSGVIVNSLFGASTGIGTAAVETNDNGVVSEVVGGGTSTFNNYGVTNYGMQVLSYAGSTVTNASNAQIDAYGHDSYMYTYCTAAGVSGCTAAATNSFTNAGVVGAVTSYNDGVIEFEGNTTALNTGAITQRLLFTNSDAGPSAATFTFGQGSVLTGDINEPNDLSNSTYYGRGGVNGLAALTVNFTNSGLYAGNVYGVTATNKTGPGTWVLEGDTLGLGTTTISGGMLQIGTYSSETYLLNEYYAYAGYYGFNTLLGNTAINPALNGLSGLGVCTDQTCLSQITSAVVTGNITIGTAGALEGGSVLFEGNIANNGVYLSGFIVPGDPSTPLGNLLDNANTVLPGHNEISGNYTQSSTGTLATNFSGTIARPARTVTGSQSDLFQPATYWLTVSPFTGDKNSDGTLKTPSTLTTVDGTATIAGTVKVYVDKNGLYVDGDSRDILTSKGALAVTATTTQSAPSLFVGFTTSTHTAGGLNVLSVAVKRTSYASVAGSANQAAVGAALDSAVPVVANEIAANNFSSTTAFSNAQDLAGFLSDMDWNVGSAAQAQSILADLSPDAYAALAAFDTGEGFRGQIERHLTDQRGEGAVDDPAVGAWAQGYGLSQRIDSNKGIGGLSGSTSGLSAGWDAQIDNAVIGIAAGYSLSNLGGHGSNFQGHLTGYQIGAYGTATWGPWYVDGSLWGNFSSGNVTRHLTSIDRTGTATLNSSGFRVNAEGGYRFETDDGYGITPYLSVGYRDTNYGNITEQGLGGLGVMMSNVSGAFFTPQLGVTADGKWSVTDMVTVKPLAGIAVEFEGNPDDISAQFLGGGNPFVIKSAVSNSVAFKPEAGLNVLVGRGTSFQIGYQGTFGSGYEINGGWVGLRINW